MASLPFASYAPNPEHFDEVFGSEGRPRPHWKQFAQMATRLSRAGLSRRANTIRRAVEQDGVTYNVYADAKGASPVGS
jgi:uncharacterized circularly permuted ATP-grasp superfamily protein